MTTMVVGVTEESIKNKMFSEENLKQVNVPEDSVEDFWHVLSSQVKSQIISQFGLAVILDNLGLGGVNDFKDGGEISTVHNAENGVFTDQEHKQRYEKKFNRKDYEGIANTSSKSLTGRRRAVEATTGIAKDRYREGPESYQNVGDMDVDHIVSAKEIHNNNHARLYLTDAERDIMATSDENMAFTDSGINRSKQDKPLMDWADAKNTKDPTKTNAEYYNVDKNNAQALDKAARKSIKHKVLKGAAVEAANGAKKIGIQQAKRQVVGILLLEFMNPVITELKNYAASFSTYKGIKARVDGFKYTIARIRIKLAEKLKESKQIIEKVIKGAFEGFTSGVVGSIVTGIINLITTTLKSWGKILQDGITTFFQAVKLWIKNPNHLSKTDLFKEVSKMIGSGIAVSASLVMVEKIKEWLAPILGPTNILVDSIATVLGAIVAGLLTGLVIYTIDNFAAIVKEVKDFFSTIKYQLTVSKAELEAKYREAINKIDDAYQDVLISIEKMYAKLDNLSSMTVDFSLPVQVRFDKSIEFARMLGVDDKDIMKNMDDINHYFLD